MYFVVDTSRSMGDEAPGGGVKLDITKQSLQKFLIGVEPETPTGLWDLPGPRGAQMC